MYNVLRKTSMELLPEIARRATVTEFLDKSISPEILERILEAGRLAPSAKNRQPWRIIAIREKVRRDKIAEACYGESVVKSAPLILAVCSTNVDYRMPNGQVSYPIDLTFCADSMIFQALHENLDTCIFSTYREEEIKEILTVPHSMRVPLLLLMGYSAEKIKKHTERLPISRIVSYEHW